jgi:hypothetical protein
VILGRVVAQDMHWPVCRRVESPKRLLVVRRAVGGGMILFWICPMLVERAFKCIMHCEDQLAVTVGANEATVQGH